MANAAAGGLAHFAASLTRATRSLNAFHRGLNRGGGGGGGGRGVDGPFSNFLWQRLRWQAYEGATGGLGAIGTGALRAFQNTGSGDMLGLASRAVTTSALQGLNAAGLNLFQIQQLSAAAAATGSITEQIARVGGVVDPEMREAVMRTRTAAERRAYDERLEVQKLLEKQYGPGSELLNENNLGPNGAAILNALQTLNGIARAILRAVSGGLF